MPPDLVQFFLMANSLGILPAALMAWLWWHEIRLAALEDAQQS